MTWIPWQPRPIIPSLTGGLSSPSLQWFQLNGISCLRVNKVNQTRFLSSSIMWISLSYAVPLSRRLGETGSQVIARFFGFVLLAIGWTILTKGLIELMPGLA
jgi:hypothetical protein